MGFVIATSVSHSYRPVAEMCLPSWYRNAGADAIDIHTFRGSDEKGAWFANLAERCRFMQGAVRQAVRDRRKLLLMDADCIVIKDLSAGFCDDKPFSLTRWPKINMGVMFINAELAWPFVDFFDEFADRAAANCMALVAENPHDNPGDQRIMHEMIGAHEGAVAKLPQHVWNYTCDPRPRARAYCRDEIAQQDVRVLHIRLATFGRRTGDVQCARDYLRDVWPKVKL